MNGINIGNWIIVSKRLNVNEWISVYEWMNVNV